MSFASQISSFSVSFVFTRCCGFFVITICFGTCSEKWVSWRFSSRVCIDTRRCSKIPRQRPTDEITTTSKVMTMPPCHSIEEEARRNGDPKFQRLSRWVESHKGRYRCLLSFLTAFLSFFLPTFIPAFLHSFLPLFIRPFVHSFIDSFIY